MNAILGTVQTVKAEQSLNSLKKLSAPEAKVIRDGVLMQIPSREVTIGDEVIIEAGAVFRLMEIIRVCKPEGGRKCADGRKLIC